MRAGVIMLLSAVVIWGWTFVASKILLKYCSPPQIMGLRLVQAVFCLLALAFAGRVPLKVAAGAWPRLAIGALILPVHLLVQIIGLKYTTATNTGWILAVSPLVIVILSGLLAREALGWRVWTGVAGASIGLLLLVSRGDFAALSFGGHFGDWLVLFTAFTWAAYTLVTRGLPAGQHPLVTSLCVMSPMTLGFLIYLLAARPRPDYAAWPPEAWLACLFLGVLGMGLAHWFWQEGVQRVGAARAGMFLYLEPLATLALAVAVLDEKLGWYTWVGGGLIIAAVLLAELRMPAAAAAAANAAADLE